MSDVVPQPPDPAPDPDTPIDPVREPIDVVELPEMLEYAAAAMQDASQRVRRAIVGDALLTFGARFLFTVSEMKERSPDPQVDALWELTSGALLEWFAGDTFTDRFDEDERRALTAKDYYDIVGPGAVRLRARAALRLPPGQPLRVIDVLRGPPSWTTQSTGLRASPSGHSRSHTTGQPSSHRAPKRVEVAWPAASQETTP